MNLTEFSIDTVRERLEETNGFVPCDGGAHVTNMLARGEIYVSMDCSMFKKLWPFEFCHETNMWFLNAANKLAVRKWINNQFPR